LEPTDLSLKSRDGARETPDPEGIETRHRHIPDDAVLYASTVSKPTTVSVRMGSPERIRELLGDAFELQFEPGTTTLRMPDGESVWELFVNGYGPTKALAASCDPERREQLRRDFIAFHERYRSDLGIAMPRDYLVTIGRRK
jgi:hypothetical protein